MIQVTWFGWVFMPLLVVVVLWARPWLPGLVLGSAVFQAAAVVNLPVGAGHYGISPYVASAAIAGLVMLWRRCGSDQSPISPPAHIHTPAMWLLAYAALAVAGSFVLPHIFSGIPVQPPLDPNGYSLNDLPPLQWSISNLAQTINLCIHVTVAFFIWQSMKRPDWSTNKTFIAFGVAAAIAIFAGLHDRVATALDWPRMASFWMSNLGYVQVETLPAHIPYDAQPTNSPNYFEIHRISSPFSEPSYGSAFFSSVYVGGLAVLLFDRRTTMLQYLATSISAVALISTIGSTGWIAGFTFTVFFLALKALKALKALNRTRAPFRKKFFYANLQVRVLIVTAGLCALLLSFSFTPLTRTAPALINFFVINKTTNLKNDGRFLSDMRAFSLTQRTYGLGVGLGSNRSSSFITSLLSNTGIAGTTSFLMMATTLMLNMLRGNRNTPTARRYFGVTALGSSLFSVSLAIPDLNLPFLWAFIFLAFILSPPEVTDTQNITKKK